MAERQPAVSYVVSQHCAINGQSQGTGVWRFSRKERRNVYCLGNLIGKGEVVL